MQSVPPTPRCAATIVAAWTAVAAARAERRRQADDALEFERDRADALREQIERIVLELEGRRSTRRRSRGWRPRTPRRARR